MANNKVEISGVNTGELEVLTQDEMIVLFEKMHKGDEMARNDLVKGNLRLVFSILKRFKGWNENMDDLFQVGSIGLVKSIDNFDLSQNVKFSTYAVPMIAGEIRRYLRDNNSIRVSRSTKDLGYKASKIKEEEFMLTGKEMPIEEIALKLDVKPYDVVNALEALRDPVSMFEPVYNANGDTIYLCDQIEDKKQTGNSALNRFTTEDAISSLSEREQYILDERFVIGKTQMEIAEELSISQAQVSRLEKNAIKQLKKILK